MALTRVATVAAGFNRDLEFDLGRVRTLIQHAGADGVQLLVLPDAVLGGYLLDTREARTDDLPPAFTIDDPVVRQVAGWAGRAGGTQAGGTQAGGTVAGGMVVCFGFCERDGADRFNTALCVSGDGVLGRHRKVHQPPGERAVYAPGDGFAAFDTPHGRIGMLIDYDKTFPEATRALALDGADLVACLCAWPTSRTNRAARMADDRQSRLFDLYDRARAAENQLVFVSSNLTGSVGGMRFLGQAKIVGPGGDIQARTWSKAGIAQADLDVRAELDRAREVLGHLRELRPETYVAARLP